MIVLDTSAALSGLVRSGPAREALAHEQIHAPHLIDSELASALRRHVSSGLLSGAQGRDILDTWSRLGLSRYGTLGLLGRVWELRHNLSAYDAGYVALAEVLGCPLLTADARLARANGIRCPVTVLPPR